MTNTISLDAKYSTTQLLTKEKPVVENKLEDKFETVLFLPEGENRKGEGGLRTKGYFKKSYEDKPLISIVTVVFNGGKYLEETIQSVINQSYDNVEYIIIDGGSTDGTLDIVKKYEDKIDYWVSEADSGIYAAMNKGISLCTGDWVAFLNADDWYFKDSLELVANTAVQTNLGYIFGNVDLYEGDKLVGTRFPNLKRYKRGTPIGHQALFVKLTYLRKIPFNTKYKIVADYDMMIKLIKLKIPYLQLNRVLVNYRVTGLSSESDLSKENFPLHVHHFGYLSAIIYFILKTKQPLIMNTVKVLVSIKHSFKQRKFVWNLE